MHQGFRFNPGQDSTVEVPVNSQHQPQDIWVRTYCSSHHWIMPSYQVFFLSETPDIVEQRQPFPHCTLYKSPCHKICEHNKKVVFMLFSFGKIYFASRMWIWLALPFLSSSNLDSRNWAECKWREILRTCDEAWCWPWYSWFVEPTSTIVHLQASWDVKKINKLLFVYATVYQIICYLQLEAFFTHTINPTGKIW